MRQETRLSLILDLLAEKGSVTVTELVEALEASSASIRRDLELLESQHLLSRTHGGAVAGGLAYELPLRYRGGRNKEEKQRIAAVAATRVGEGPLSLGLTGGTTTTEVARALVNHKGLTIVTNALNIASELALRPNLKLIVTGGTARSESYELVGPLAEASLEGMNLDLAFVGVDGISADVGLSTHHEVEAHTNRVLIERTRRVIVVADGSKVGHKAFARICPPSGVSELITDASADADALQQLENAGIKVTLA
ncbi:DeoR/GlpR family DNA-binding transcription regulator [Paludibacterium purpuratum]|uniref:DeoR family transcriptional regulator n=1 Tax=Paludibacterium purpuratum TaxID=1144873 RepID=A0A4R7AYX8_9NEIS|nr:DeoR/GlpR family DNA-binding transcription regulator [Paludibacterium purpuratum]TDR73290.1 DeoR family transcriptional regulator [Paludibacterium purpuratum]